MFLILFLIILPSFSVVIVKDYAENFVKSGKAVYKGPYGQSFRKFIVSSYVFFLNFFYFSKKIVKISFRL
jgi:hypothetical protein